MHMGKPKLKRPKTRHHYSLARIKELHELRDRLTPKGLEMTDGQAIDVIVSTMHEVIIEKRFEVVEPDKLMALLNRQFRTEFVESMTKILAELGHTDIETEWLPDFSVKVTCDGGGFTVPAQMFARADAESTLRELKTGLSI